MEKKFAGAGASPTSRKRATLGDVARAARVSVMTVSNVINGKHAGSVSPQTLRRVQQEINRLNYRPDQSARSLRLSQTLTVSMIIVDESRLFMEARFVAQLVTGLTNALGDAGYSLIIQGVTPESFGNAAVMQRFANDGLVAHLAGPDKERIRYQKLLLAMGLPLCLIQDHPLIKLPDCCFVSQEDMLGGRLLADLVLAGGARKLVYLKARRDWPAVSARGEGVRTAAAKYPDASVVVVTSEDEGLATTQEALRGHFALHGLPDAILGANDHLAVAAMKLVQSLGLHVPDDIAITGFHDYEYRQYAEPALTTIRSNGYEIGFLAGVEMIHRLSHGSFRTRETLLPVSLIRGGSTPPVRAGTSGTIGKATTTAL